MSATAIDTLPTARSSGELLGTRLPEQERFYQQMVLIRLLEERLLELFSQGLLTGTTHTSIGQEANAVGVINSLDRSRDGIWSNHRCHGHFIAYCAEIAGLVAEIMGKRTGVCAGRGGSQHLCFRRFRSNGIQGGIAPVAVGSALAMRRTNAVSVVFLGDGTMGEGAVYESLNIAAVLGAPVLFVVEDNDIAQTTPKALTVAGSIMRRAEPFGIRTFAYDGCDPVEIHKVASEAVDHVRTESQPGWLYLRTERIGPHSKGDDTRSAERIAAAKARDPLDHMRPKIARAAEIEDFCRAVVEEAIQAAMAAPGAQG